MPNLPEHMDLVNVPHHDSELCWRLAPGSQIRSTWTTTGGKAMGSWVPIASCWSWSRDSCHQGLTGWLFLSHFFWFFWVAIGFVSLWVTPLQKATPNFFKGLADTANYAMGRYAVRDNINWALTKWQALFSLPHIDTIAIQESHRWGNWDTEMKSLAQGHTPRQYNKCQASPAGREDDMEHRVIHVIKIFSKKGIFS